MSAVFGEAQSFIVTGEGVTRVDLIQEKKQICCCLLFHSCKSRMTGGGGVNRVY